MSQQIMMRWWRHNTKRNPWITIKWRQNFKIRSSTSDIILHLAHCLLLVVHLLRFHPRPHSSIIVYGQTISPPPPRLPWSLFTLPYRYVLAPPSICTRPNQPHFHPPPPITLSPCYFNCCVSQLALIIVSLVSLFPCDWCPLTVKYLPIHLLMPNHKHHTMRQWVRH